MACAGNTWTINQLGDAIQSPYVDASLKPHLEAALNEAMDAIWSGQQIEAVTVALPSMDFSSWTVNELADAIQNPETDPALIPHLESALNHMMEALFAGVPVVAAAVSVPATELHYYTLNEVSELLQNPATNPELIPYLETALNEMMSALFEGHQMDFVVIAVPVGLNPVEVPAEVIPAPVETVLEPSPAETGPAAPAVSSSPLVQIIINVNQAAPAALPAAPAQVAEIAPEPVHVVESAPEPVQVVETAPIAPEPVQVVETIPEPVQVVEIAPEPVNVVEVPSVPIGVVVPVA